MTTPAHIWSFWRAGGFDQVKLTSGADLLHLDQLDQKLWVALACPTTGLEFDSQTLKLIDADHDGRIRARDIIAACRWAGTCLHNPDDLLKGASELPLAAIKDPQLLASAKQILANLEKSNATTLTIDDASDTVKIFAGTHFNGDGIIPVSAAGDAATQAVINDIIACCGSEIDRNGKPGISQAKLEQFFTEGNAFAGWYDQADAKVLPLGTDTPAAAAMLRAVQTKVDDYFSRCRLAAYDPRALPALNRHETEYLTLAGKDLSRAGTEVAGFPLARIVAGQPLPLTTGINPAWTTALAEFQSRVVVPVLGDQAALTEADWDLITGKFSAYETWAARPAGPAVEKLGIQRVREILAGNSQAKIAALIAKDRALEPEANRIADVEKLIRYYRDLYRLCVNFVNFQDFYSRRKPAIFQAGTLYLDQRSCELTLYVEDASRHVAMASLAGAYLAYCDCVHQATGEKRQIVAAFTGGDSDNLMVGRNGVFYDRHGRDWDATITRVVDNPISLRQAFWAPYKKFIRVIEEFMAKRAADANTAATAQVQNAAPPELPKKIDTGTLAAIGLVLTTLLTALGGIFGVFAKLPIWQVPVALFGIMMAISIPSMLLAWLKLRKRNLGPILDANGWAVNAKARINVPFGAALTSVAKLPIGSHRDLVDPYAESTAGRNRTILILVVAGLVWGAWFFGAIEHFFPQHLPKSRYLIWREAAKLSVTNAPTAH